MAMDHMKRDDINNDILSNKMKARGYHTTYAMGYYLVNLEIRVTL